MSHPDPRIAPVPTHITNIHELLAGMGKQQPRKHVRAVYRTFALTAANPVMPILGEDLSRFDTWLVAYGNSVVICESQSQAQDPQNLSPLGTGAFAGTPVNPQGTLLYVPSAIAGTSSQSQSNTGSVTSPTLGQTIASLALAAGTYTVNWTAQLGGAQSATDTDNFGLYNGATLIATSLDTGSAPVTPSVPATTVVTQNPNPYPVTVVITAGGSTISAVTVNGLQVGTAAGTYIVPSAGSISISYTVSTPTWAWSNASGPSAFAQEPETVVIPAGGATLAVKAIAAGTTGAIYASQLTATIGATSGNTPVAQSVRWTIDSTEVVYATAAAYPAFLAMTTHNKVTGF